METGDEGVTATVEGEDLGLFIGRHGQTIEAVQHLAQRVVFRRPGPRGAAARVVVDAAGYRARRREALQGQAADAADEAARYSRPVALDAMSATERRIVHEHLRDRGRRRDALRGRGARSPPRRRAGLGLSTPRPGGWCFTFFSPVKHFRDGRRAQRPRTGHRVRAAAVAGLVRRGRPPAPGHAADARAARGPAALADRALSRAAGSTAPTTTASAPTTSGWRGDGRWWRISCPCSRTW